jgi:hypothetical protein
MQILRVAADYLKSSVTELFTLEDTPENRVYILRAYAYSKADEEGGKLKAALAAQRAEVHG